MKEYIVHAPADDVLAVERYTSFYGGPAEELIRCKDCKWCRTFYHGENMPFSYECAKLWLTGIGVDDFCSKAESKGD